MVVQLYSLGEKPRPNVMNILFTLSFKVVPLDIIFNLGQMRACHQLVKHC